MAKTLADAQKKWEEKTANAGANWKAAVQGKGPAYAKGVSDFVGAPVAGSIVSAYERGIARTSATAFQKSISGRGSKWAENYRNKMTTGHK